MHHQGLTHNYWKKLSYAEQMANVGAEVKRAFFWQKKNKPHLSQKAFERSLELLDLTLATQAQYPKLKETARTREVLVDYFFGSNQYQTDAKSLNQYFYQFNYLANKTR